MNRHDHQWRQDAGDRVRCVLCGVRIPQTKREVVQTLASLAEVEAYRAQVRFDGRDWQEGELAALVERERVLTERAR